jgi:hypothetical protein
MPKLTLRDLFAVVTIVALGLGWWVDRRRTASDFKRLTAQKEKAIRAAHEWEDMARALESTLRHEEWEDCVWWPDPVPNDPRVWWPARDQTSHSK